MKYSLMSPIASHRSATLHLAHLTEAACPVSSSHFDIHSEKQFRQKTCEHCVMTGYSTTEEQICAHANSHRLLLQAPTAIRPKISTEESAHKKQKASKQVVFWLANTMLHRLYPYHPLWKFLTLPFVLLSTRISANLSSIFSSFTPHAYEKSCSQQRAGFCIPLLLW